MNIKKHIPNILTLSNLACGILSIFLILNCDNTFLNITSEKQSSLLGVYLIFIGSFFDFLDGFIANMLNAKSELGKQLDSFADLVTFGIAPSFLMWELISFRISNTEFAPIAYGIFIFPIFATIRLAKFNISKNQNISFKGMPVPSAALFIASIYIFMINNSSLFFLLGGNTYHLPWYEITLLSIVLLFSILMISSINMLSLKKFHTWSWSNNKLHYLFTLLSLIVFLKFYFAGISIIVVLYLFFSIIYNFSKNEI